MIKQSIPIAMMQILVMSCSPGDEPDPACPGYETGVGLVEVNRPHLTNIKERPLTCLSGNGRLQGRFIEAITSDGRSPAFNKLNDFRFKDDNPAFREVQVYYYLTEMAKWIAALLPNGVKAETLTALSVELNTSRDPLYNNWDGKKIHMGGPQLPDPTILLHEYGHYLEHVLTGEYGGGKLRSPPLAQGFSDLMAALFLKDPIAGSWIVDPELIPSCVRTVKNQLRYPFDVSTMRDFSCNLTKCMEGIGVNVGPYKQICKNSDDFKIAPAPDRLGSILVAPLWDLSERTTPELAAQLALALLYTDLRSVAQLRPALFKADEALFDGSIAT